MSISKRARNIIGIVTSASAAAGAFSTAREAKEDGDKLILLNAIAKALVAATGIAIAIRALRNKDGKIG